MTIEEKARKEYPSVNPYDYPETCSYNKTSRNSFIRGASWMFKNAVRWLNDNAKNFSENAEELIKQFEEAMEE